jgi:hypothetical protein
MLQGALTGTIAAATLVAGVVLNSIRCGAGSLQTAIAIGSSLGPLLGIVADSLYRPSFYVQRCCCSPGILVTLLVHEISSGGRRDALSSPIGVRRRVSFLLEARCWSWARAFFFALARKS